MTKIGDTVAQTGLHAVIFGERGVGKTSLTYVIEPLLNVLDEHNAPKGTTPEPRLVVRVNAHTSDTFSTIWTKAFDEIWWVEDRPILGFTRDATQERVSLRAEFGIPDDVTIDLVRRTLAHLRGAVFIFDEFDRLPKEHTGEFTDLIKTLSDHAIPATIVLVGVAETVEGLMRDHASIGRALTQIPMPRMTSEELDEILKKAEDVLEVSFDSDARRQIVRMSQGLPHFTHLIGLHAVRAAADRRSRTVSCEDVEQGFKDAVSEADQTVASAYRSAVHSAQPGAKFPQVLLAAAIAAYTNGDEAGYFQPSHLVSPMTTIMGRPEEISGFNTHLSQFMETRRGAVLERTGTARAYRFRFTHPLLPPYIVMRGLRDGLVSSETMNEMLAADQSR